MPLQEMIRGLRFAVGMPSPRPATSPKARAAPVNTDTARKMVCAEGLAGR